MISESFFLKRYLILLQCTFFWYKKYPSRESILSFFLVYDFIADNIQTATLQRLGTRAAVTSESTKAFAAALDTAVTELSVVSTYTLDAMVSDRSVCKSAGSQIGREKHRTLGSGSLPSTFSVVLV